VIEREIEVRGKEHSNRHSVDVVPGHGVAGVQHVVEVVRVPIVADE